MRLPGVSKNDPLARSAGLSPNNKPKDPRIKRLGVGVGVAVLVGGVAVVAVIANGVAVRTGKHKSGGTQSAGAGRNGGDTTGAGQNGTTQIANLQKDAGAGQPRRHQPATKAAGTTTTQKTPGQKVAAMASHKKASADPTAPIVQQAWLQYVSAVVKQTQQWTDQRRHALTAGLTVQAPGSGSTKAGDITTTPTAYTASGGNPFAGLKTSGAGTDGIGSGGVGAMHFGSGGGNAASLSAAQKRSYLGKLRGNPDYLGTSREAPISRNVLRAGTVIPAEMETGIKSDLPGQILARVTSNVYNTPNGSEVLIPQGAELIGTYDNNVSNGQNRVLVVWNRIIYPDGSSLDIGSMPGASPNGYAGLHDEVNDHYLRIFGDALLMSVFSAGVQLSQPSGGPNSVYSSQQVIAGSLGQQLGQTGQTLISHDLNIAPTLTIRKGYRFDVMITRDLVIKPWQSVASLGATVNGDGQHGDRGPMWVAEPLQRNHLAPGGLAAGGRSGETDGQPRSTATIAGRRVLAAAALPPSSTALQKDGSSQFVPVLAVPPDAVKAAPRAAPLPAPPPVPTWALSSGPLVGRQITGWGQQAGWHVIWDVGQDWPVPRPSTFKGSFASAATQVIEDLSAEGAPVHATFYRGNRTLVITGDEK